MKFTTRNPDDGMDELTPAGRAFAALHSIEIYRDEHFTHMLVAKRLGDTLGLIAVVPECTVEEFAKSWMQVTTRQQP